MIRLTRDRDFYRTMLVVALPAALQSLITLLVNLADEIMITRLGETVPGNWLGGVGLTNQIANLFVMTVFGLTAGGSVLISQYWGRRDMQRIRQLFSIVLTIVTGLGLVAALLVRAFPGQILGLFTSDQEVIRCALPYITIFCFTFIPFAISQALIGMLRAVEIVRISLVVSSISLITNIVFNWALIFGKLGMPALGVQGAAIATLIARLVELVIVWVYVFHKQQKVPLKLRDLRGSEGFLWRDYARFGLPVALGDMQWAVIGLCKTAIVGHLGGLMIASNTIADRMMTLGLLVCNALAVGASVVIGKTVGRKDYDKTREYSTSIQWLFLGFGLLFGTLVLLLRGAFVGLYGAPAEVATLAIAMIALGAPTMVGTAYHASCFMGINRGAGDSRFVMWVDMICGWLIVLPLSALAAYVWKVPYAWMFLFLRIDQCFKWIIAFIRLRGNKWIKNVTRA